MSEEALREGLVNSFKHRALLYYLIFDEMRKEMGAAKAAEILKRAIRRRGEQIGQVYAEYGPADLEGLRRAFLANLPDDGRLFNPEVTRSDDEGLDIVLQDCPLKEAWQEANLSDEDATIMCEIAAEIDHGTFAAAGFSFSAETWQPGRRGCCHLHIRPGN